MIDRMHGHVDGQPGEVAGSEDQRHEGERRRGVQERFGRIEAVEPQHPRESARA